MGPGKRQRKILVALGVVVLGLILLVGALPLWFPWVFGPVARMAGLQYTGYERRGYGGFELQGVSYTNRTVNVKAEHVRAVVPSVWILRLAIKRWAGAGEPFFAVRGWTADYTARSTTYSVYARARKVERNLDLLAKWAPDGVLSNGVVRVRGEETRVPELRWARGNAWGKAEIPKAGAAFDFRLDRAPSHRLQIRSERLQVDSRILVETSASGQTLSSTNIWRGNSVVLGARFGLKGKLPEEAHLRAREVQIPAELFKLRGYGAIRGSLNADWRDGRFAVDLEAGAGAGATNVPPLVLELRASGNTNAAVVDTAVVSAPWLRAELTRRLPIHFRGKVLSEPAHLSFRADLGRQPWLEARGILKGELDLRPGAGEYPEAEFELTGKDVGSRDIVAKLVETKGRVAWPLAGISEGRASFDDGSRLLVDGQVDLERKYVNGAKFEFAGPLLRRWVPRGYSYQDLKVSGQFGGPLEEIEHRGRLEITNLIAPDLQPLRVGLDWTGRGRSVSDSKVVISAGTSSLLAEGTARVNGGGGEGVLKSLTLSRKGTEALDLEKPARIWFHPQGGGKGTWEAGVESLHWRGPEGDLQADLKVNWPGAGNIKASVRNFRSTIFEDFLKPEVEPVVVQALNFSADWLNGPVSFGLEISGEHGKGLPLSGELKASGDFRGVFLERLDVRSGGASAAKAEGFAGLTVNPGRAEGVVVVNGNTPVRLEASVQSQGVFWDKVAELSGARFVGPDLRVAVSGTTGSPRAKVQLRAQQIDALKVKQPLPVLRGLVLDLEVDREQARIATGRLLVQGQEVLLTGDLPLGNGFWSGIRRKKVPDWSGAEAHLRATNAQIAAFTKLYPEAVSPQGEVNIDLRLVPGLKLEGWVTLRNARTHPVGAFGAVRDIWADLLFKGRELQLRGGMGNVGGGAVEVTGRADLDLESLARSNFVAASFLTTGGLPFAIRLRGDNVPIVRKPDTIIRGNIDLVATKTNGEPPVISGDVNLHDSFFLSDLTALIPGRVAAPRQRPPYFSVESPLLAEWRLGVRVSGERFMRVRTTFFNGELTAELRLEGTLKNPVMLGGVKVASGIVQFPFGSLQVQQGLINLTSQNPYDPQLTVTATSKQFGYDLRMQMSGTATAPIIEFSSTPPLSSEQVLLLLTSGELPQGTFSLTPQQRAQTLAVFLGRDLLQKLGIGGQSGERLIIHSGEEISESGRPTYSVEFKLDKNWSLVAQYDRFGDFNAGVKWRVYSR